MAFPSPDRRSSWIAEVLAGAAVASGVGYLVTAYGVSRWLTRPSRGGPSATPASMGLPSEDMLCRTVDGHRLSGWLVEPARPRGTVVLFHGLRQNRGDTMDRVRMLFNEGYRCVTFDHRAHGKSSGKRSSFGYHEQHDIHAVLDLVDARWPHEPTAALGISMGAAALCFAGKRASRLQACVLESLYHDVASAFDNRIGTKFPAWFRRFAPGVIWVTERRLGLRLAQITPADHIAQLAPAPVLLVTGTDDFHAPPSDQEKLYARCRGPRYLSTIDGADHSNLFSLDVVAYRALVVGFLDRHLQASRVQAA